MSSEVQETRLLQRLVRGACEGAASGVLLATLRILDRAVLRGGFTFPRAASLLLIAVAGGAFLGAVGRLIARRVEGSAVGGLGGMLVYLLIAPPGRHPLTLLEEPDWKLLGPAASLVVGGVAGALVQRWLQARGRQVKSTTPGEPTAS